MTVWISSAELAGLLSEATDQPGAAGALAVLAASAEETFRPRLTKSRDLREIYTRRLRFGHLNSVPGGREFAAALVDTQESEILMVVVESPAGWASIWLAPNATSLVGVVAGPDVPER